MFTIKLNSKTIDYNPVIKYYNQNKTNDMAELEELDRIEGGFQIRKLNLSSDNNRLKDENDSICQLRWYKGYLCSYGSYSSFNNEQLQLLFNALINCYGKDNVITTSDKMNISAFSRSIIVTKVNA